jgi:hypothetical protein
MIPRYSTLLLLLLWQGTAIFKKRNQLLHDLLEDIQVLNTASALEVKGSLQQPQDLLEDP